MRRMIALCLLLLSACASGGPSLGMGGFSEIPVGATREEVIAQAGRPASSRRLDNGCEELEYTERISAGARTLQERRYILTLKDGKVVSKRIEADSPSPLQFDSYDMQTTQNISTEF